MSTAEGDPGVVTAITSLRVAVNEASEEARLRQLVVGEPVAFIVIGMAYGRAIRPPVAVSAFFVVGTQGEETAVSAATTTLYPRPSVPLLPIAVLLRW